ncbi:unnamed protein product [Sphenostylis stenocarpa]|uniref:Uncharacterized protein n=1 Tax=Sphenostylis stenocarpa TaxID=92480 RepID=A0AA86RYZ9_9FABA|nr:unnamed protein product [Sphenostylis stenocarpa]
MIKSDKCSNLARSQISTLKVEGDALREWLTRVEEEGEAAAGKVYEISSLQEAIMAAKEAAKRKLAEIWDYVV